MSHFHNGSCQREISLPHSSGFCEKGFHLKKPYSSPWNSWWQMLVYVVYLLLTCLLGGWHTCQEHLLTVSLGHGDSHYVCSPTSHYLGTRKAKFTGGTILFVLAAGLGLKVMWFASGGEHVIARKTDFPKPRLSFCNGNQPGLRYAPSDWLLERRGCGGESQVTYDGHVIWVKSKSLWCEGTEMLRSCSTAADCWWNAMS